MNIVTYTVHQWHWMPALVVEVTGSVPDQIAPKMGSGHSLLSNQSKLERIWGKPLKWSGHPIQHGAHLGCFALQRERNTAPGLLRYYSFLCGKHISSKWTQSYHWEYYFNSFQLPTSFEWLGLKTWIKANHFHLSPFSFFSPSSRCLGLGRS